MHSDRLISRRNPLSVRSLFRAARRLSDFSAPPLSLPPLLVRRFLFIPRVLPRRRNYLGMKNLWFFNFLNAVAWSNFFEDKFFIYLVRGFFFVARSMDDA